MGADLITVDQLASQETILLVEGDISIRLPVAQYLRNCGYKVIEAVDANEAMTVLLDEQTSIDVVFSAIDMPTIMDGLGLSKWVHEKRPRLDVILARAVPRTLNAAKELCDDGPLPKPHGLETVHDHIQRLLATRNAKGRE